MQLVDLLVLVETNDREADGECSERDEHDGQANLRESPSIDLHPGSAELPDPPCGGIADATGIADERFLSFGHAVV